MIKENICLISSYMLILLNLHDSKFVSYKHDIY